MAFDCKKLANYPKAAGVYIMKDKSQKVLYVGKAKNLRARLQQYFSSHDKRPQIPLLLAKLESIETIIVQSEKEALLLENTLIKKEQPKYNILLKDDKSYILLKIRNKHQWPSVELRRYKKTPPNDGLYFGPYTNADAAREILSLIEKNFRLRQCSDRELRTRKRPCILYDMKRCLAPCVGYCSSASYKKELHLATEFLKGKNAKVLEDLKQQMQLASDELAFEEAAELLRKIENIEKALESQKVNLVGTKDFDVIGIVNKAGLCCIVKISYRKGKLVDIFRSHFDNVLQEDEEILESFLLQHYQSDLPHEILLPMQLERQSFLNDLLFSQKKARLLSPKKGEKAALLEMAETNALASFEQKKNKDEEIQNLLLQLKEQMHLQNYPHHIECIDNSHISATNCVASMVCFLDGQKKPSQYRKFKIKEAASGDDYAMLEEVLIRRYQKAKEHNQLPDLVLIDGGKGHLNLAQEIFMELDITGVDLLSISKEAGKHDKGLRSEIIHSKNHPSPIALDAKSPLLFLLQRIRDEAHRVAISFQRNRQRKKALQSVLDDVPGIGPAKKKALLQHFGSLKNIQNAKLEELLEVKGISKKNAAYLIEVLRKS